jgi:hypothetical protein
MYKKALKLNLRFESPKGNLTIEDLWDLPLTSTKSASLNGVAQAISRQIKADDVENFVEVQSSTDAILNLKLDIVKDIISDKLDEREKAKNASANKAERDKIMSLIARKQETELEGKSVEELEALLGKLND